MQIIRNTKSKYEPASHEDKYNPGVLKQVLFDKNNIQKGRVEMINWAVIEAGKSFQSHFHEDMDEIFIIASGKGLIEVGSESSDIEKGDAVLIPKLSIHRMTNTGNASLQYIVIGVSYGQGGKTIIVEKA